MPSHVLRWGRLGLSLLALGWWPAAAQAVPAQLNVQGVLFDEAGTPVEGATNITVRVYDGAAGDAALLWEPAAPLDVLCEAGVFNALVPSAAEGGEAEAFAAAFATGEPRWLGIAPDGAAAELSPRIPVVSVAYALVSAKAAVADVAEVARGVDCAGCVPATALDPAVQAAFLAYDPAASGLGATTYQAAIDELAGLVEALTASLAALQAQVDGLAAVATSGAYGDLTGVPDLSVYVQTADLAAVATSGRFADLQDVPEALADGDNDTLGGLSCGLGEVPKWDDVAGWQCASDDDSDTLGGLSCGLGEVPKWDDVAGWQCASDDDSDTLAALPCAPGQVARRAADGWECASGAGQLPQVPRATTFTAVDDTTSNREYTSMTVGVDGLPIIAHYRELGSGAGLRVVHCGNPACSADNTVTLVDADAGPDNGRWSSIAIDAVGRPVIAYFDDGTNPYELKVARCANTVCSGTAEVRVLESTSGDYASLAIGQDGLPVISYRYYYADEERDPILKVAKCRDAGCGSVTLRPVDETPGAGQLSCIAIGGDGLPVIAHRVGGTSNALRVQHCNDDGCGSSNIETVVSTGSPGGGLSMTIGVDGLPVMAYYKGTDNRLWVTHCRDYNCAPASAQNSMVDPSRVVFTTSRTSITIGADGLPSVAYIARPQPTGTTGELWVLRCIDAACSEPGSSIRVDGDVPLWEFPLSAYHSPSITTGADGLPIVAYWDGEGVAPVRAVLRVAKCANPFCVPYWSRR